MESSYDLVVRLKAGEGAGAIVRARSWKQIIKIILIQTCRDKSSSFKTCCWRTPPRLDGLAVVAKPAVVAVHPHVTVLLIEFCRMEFIFFSTSYCAHLSFPVAGHVAHSRAAVPVAHLKQRCEKSKNGSNCHSNIFWLYLAWYIRMKTQDLLKTVVAVPTHVVVVVARVAPDLSRVTFLKLIFYFPELWSVSKFKQQVDARKKSPGPMGRSRSLQNPTLSRSRLKRTGGLLESGGPGGSWTWADEHNF